MIFQIYYLWLLIISMINGNLLNSTPKKCLNYCSNDGICVLKDNSPECYCLPEWEGEHCNLPRQFIPNQGNDFIIMARTNLRASQCSLKPDLCKNGGVCYFKDNKYGCACPDTHYG